jgi:4-aminobutyrate aminotransferase-like enzyme
MRIAPPLTATDEEIDLGIGMLDAAIKSVVERYVLELHAR